MATVTFDTLKFVDTLEQAQLPRAQARAIAAAVQASQETAELATKADLRAYESTIRHDLEKLDLGLRKEIDARFVQTDAKIDLVRKDVESLRWIMGAVLGGVIALIVRSFF